MILSKGFWIGRTEVTSNAFARFAAATGRAATPGSAETGDRPAAIVSWGDTAAFCRWSGGRLPTEAEWEYAARGGSAAGRYGALDEVAWYDANAGGGAQVVGRKAPNGYGLYDTLGNVWEWVADWYAPYEPASAVVQNPAGPSSGELRVLRGGSWYYGPRFARVSSRNGDQPSGRDSDGGFRCSLDVSP